MGPTKQLLPILAICLISVGANAQTGKVVQSVNNASNTVNSASSAVNTTSQTLNTAKTTFGSLKSMFGGKNKTAGVITVAISGIEYDDENFEQVFDFIEKFKGVKSASKSFKSGIATIEINTKNKPSDMWDEIPKELRQKFKLVEAGDNFVAAEYKLAVKPAGQQVQIAEATTPPTNEAEKKVDEAVRKTTEATKKPAPKKGS